MKFILRPTFIYSTILGLLAARKGSKSASGYIRLIPWISWVLLLVFQYAVYKEKEAQKKESENP